MCVMSLFLILSTAQALVTIDADNPNIQYSGRINHDDPKAPIMWWPGSGVVTSFEGTSINVKLHDYGDNYFYVIIDDGAPSLIDLTPGEATYPAASGLTDSVHKIRLFKRTETQEGRVAFLGFELDDSKSLVAPPERPQRRIEYYGDSITSGHSVASATGDTNEAWGKDNYYTYASVTARNLNAEYHCISVSGIGLYVDTWGFGGNMQTLYYDRESSRTTAWDFNQWTPHIVVVNLGQNDYWGTYTQAGAEQNYINFAQTLRGHYPDAYIILALGSMNATDTPSPWPTYLQNAVNELNTTYGDPKVYRLIFPFSGNPHPTVARHADMADQLTEFIQATIPGFGNGPDENADDEVLYLIGSKPPALEDLRLWDTSNVGYSQFRTTLENEGYKLTQQEAGPGSSFTLTASYLNQFQVLILSSNNREFSATEEQIVWNWVNAGGGLVAWSDSAFGRDADGNGSADPDSLKNTVGRDSNNSLTDQFGLFFMRDTGGQYTYGGPGQAGDYQFDHYLWQNDPIDNNIIFKGEGVSPMIVSPPAQILAYWQDADRVNGGSPYIMTEDAADGATWANTAGLAIATVGSGRVVGTFDRNTFWNNGAGTDIDELDNRQYARNLINWAATGGLPVCGDTGTVMTADISGPSGQPDCYINMYDLTALTDHWLDCTLPGRAGCVGTGQWDIEVKPISTAAITIDGDLSDWAAVQWLDANHERGSGTDDLSNAQVAFLWDGTEEALYVAARVDDAALALSATAGSWDEWDSFEISCKGDGIPSDDTNWKDSQTYAEAQQWRFGVIPSGGAWLGTPVTAHPGTVEQSGSVSGNTLYYEAIIKQYSFYDKDNAANSVLADLDVGAEILCFVDLMSGKNAPSNGPYWHGLPDGRVHNVPSTWARLRLVDADGNDGAVCGDYGYPPVDIISDCVVDMKDWYEIALKWMDCTDPADENCESIQ